MRHPTSVRRTLLALLTALLVLATPALAGAQAPAATPVQDDELLAPPGRCAHDANAGAHHRLQRLAMQCLLRQLRRRADLPRLRESVALRHSATYKARRIAACKVFTHTPCGDELTVPFEQAQLSRTGDWHLGENLAWGSTTTPRRGRSSPSGCARPATARSC